MAEVIRPETSAAVGMASTSAVVAAQPIEEKASANVASREEVWRRRNWLRRACTRNQSWIEVEAMVAISTPQLVTAACHGAIQANAAISGAKMMQITISPTSILARTTRVVGSGAVAPSSGASSPDIVSQA